VKLNTKVDIEKSSDENFVRMIINPLEKGYGNTLGNSIRRVLLSSLNGSAITSVKIDGAEHEFSSLVGVKEDVVDIILNLKKICIKNYSSGIKTITLNTTKKGEILASDIIHDSEIEIINKDQYIATITGNTKLMIEMRIENGIGYRLAEQNNFDEMPLGTIIIDCDFSPVIKVNHLVENTRVGNQTELDKLTLEVWTDGTIKAEDAVDKASSILIDSFSLFTDYKHIVPLAQPEFDKKDKTESINENLDLSIEDLELSARSSNCLRKAGIQTVCELVEKPMKDLMKIKNFGKKSADEINDKLVLYGLKLKED
jgi:DNA-directed RNA polymerase subunit alpha